MSPSWRNRLFVAISPTRISMIKLGYGLKPKVQATFDETVIPVGKQPSWQAVLDRFTQLLSQPEWQKAEVNVVLSNQFFWFDTLTFSVQLKHYAAQEAFARHSLSQTYGAATEQWTLRTQQGKNGTSRLVSAVDRALLDGLRQVCAAHQLKLNLVTPSLAAVFNRFQKELKTDPAWLVIHEPGYSLLALISTGQFVAINGVYDTINELPVLLDRENLISTLPKPCTAVYLYAPSLTDLSVFPKTPYAFSKLDIAVPEGFPAQSEGLFAMLMSEFM